MRRTRRRRGRDVDFRRRPLQRHAEQVGDVPGGADGETKLEADVGGHAGEHRTDGDAEQDLGRAPVGDLEGFLEVLLLEVLFQHPGVEVVVHVVIEPRQRAVLDGLEALRGGGLAVGRALDTHHETLRFTRGRNGTSRPFPNIGQGLA